MAKFKNNSELKGKDKAKPPFPVLSKTSKPRVQKVVMPIEKKGKKK